MRRFHPKSSAATASPKGFTLLTWEDMAWCSRIVRGGGLSLKVHRNRSVRSLVVSTDGQGLVSQAGTVLLAEMADRSGLRLGLSVAMADCGISWHTHDPGVVLTHLGVAIANGADCLADFAALGEQHELLGPVASLAAAWRAIEAVTSTDLRGIATAMAQARVRVWDAAETFDGVTLDFDATLVTSHSDKQDAAPTYKRGFGFHPLGVWCDETNESTDDTTPVDEYATRSMW